MCREHKPTAVLCWLDNVMPAQLVPQALEYSSTADKSNIYVMASHPVASKALRCLMAYPLCCILPACQQTLPHGLWLCVVQHSIAQTCIMKTAGTTLLLHKGATTAAGHWQHCPSYSAPQLGEPHSKQVVIPRTLTSEHIRSVTAKLPRASQSPIMTHKS